MRSGACGGKIPNIWHMRFAGARRALGRGQSAESLTEGSDSIAEFGVQVSALYSINDFMI